jgi:hypothetical protein
MTLAEFILTWRALDHVVRGRCFYCGVQTRRGGLKPSNAIFQTKDHVIPSSAEGCPRRANCVICCRRCNSMKDNLTMQEFRQLSGIAVFFAEKTLGLRVDDLDDIAEVTSFVMNRRRPGRRSIKCNGRPGPQPSIDIRQG